MLILELHHQVQKGKHEDLLTCAVVLVGRLMAPAVEQHDAARCRALCRAKVSAGAPGTGTHGLPSRDKSAVPVCSLLYGFVKARVANLLDLVYTCALSVLHFFFLR